LVNAWASDNLFGIGRWESQDADYQEGQDAGDRAALAQGAAEIAAGDAGIGAGSVLVLTGAGAPEGGLVITGSAALEGHGLATVTAAGVHIAARSSQELKPTSTTPATEPYKRPSGATTNEQRANAQKSPCSNCGKHEPGKMRANHKKALVQEHYETGTVDKKKMRSPGATNSHCDKCSASQGGRASAYSKEMKKKIKK
jgi:hypothetical protein